MDNKEQSISATFLAICPPIEAYQWLERNWVKPSVGTDSISGRCTLEENRRAIDYILVRRKDSLIDLALSQFSYSSFVLKRLFHRGGIGVRCAILANPCLFASQVQNKAIIDLKTVVDRDNRREIAALVENPYLPNEFYEHLLCRTNYFSDISERQYKFILVRFGSNRRLTEPYKNTLLDGWREFSYENIFSIAWNLSKSLPATQEWAGILHSMLEKAVIPAGFKDIESTIKRWEIDLMPKDGDAHPWPGYSYYLRSRLADFLNADENLLGSTDPALRQSFYRRFAPSKFKEWPDFAKDDGDIFLEEAIRENLQLWKREEERERLRELAWGHPDPSHGMLMPNIYNGMEERVRNQHSGWFVESNDGSESSSRGEYSNS